MAARKPVFQKVPTEMNFPAEEKAILELWKAKDVFQKSLAKPAEAGKGDFVFYEGPPTANGLPHNGHVLTRVIKDLFPRYRTMRGYHVGRKAGWDTHGLPVEVEVEKELRIHGKAAIEAYGVEPFIAKCIDSVFRYTREWEELTERIGFWVDLGDAYVTYHKSYVESVWWALSKLFEKGLLYKGHKVVWWWAQGGTALSAAEVGQGYRTVDDPSVYVRFPVHGHKEKTSLVVWTTTPWTLPSNMYAAVKADVDYVEVEYEGERLIMAAALRETLAKKLKAELPVTETYKGTQLEGLGYEPPFDLYTKQYAHDGDHLAWNVYAADFVTLDTGTGIVHIAPAFGEDDYKLFQSAASGGKWPSRQPVCAVKPDGSFVDAMGPKYAGRWVKDCDRDIIHELKERGLLLHAEQYRHEYPFCPRAENDPLIQLARPAWYIRTTEQKDRAIQNNQAVHWLPEHIKEGRMGDFLANNVDWALSRERWWGTPLNVWVCDEDKAHLHAPASVAAIEEMAPGAFDHFREAKKKDPSLNDHLIVHKPWVDRVVFPCTHEGCSGTMKRVPEVIDCWFDSGSMPFAQWGFPHVPGSEDKLRANFPAQFISEAIDQTRGWFYSLLMISTLLFDEKTCADYKLPPALPHPYQTCIVLGHVCDKEGKKESKSRGNYTPPDIVYDEVKLEFAVVSAKDAAERFKAKLKPGADVLIAPEDMEGMDLVDPAQGKELRAAGGKKATVTVQTAKGLPRRVLVLSDAVLASLGVRPTAKPDVKPAEVARLPSEERVVLFDPATPAPGADAFRWFFYASSPPWSNTRHSLSNVRHLQKEFLVKLRNTYSFFVIYANIDGYDPAHPPSVAPEPGELDRWILSELAQTTQRVTADMDAYDVYPATQKLVAFVDGLSNWYVRRSRERFWRAGWDGDKRAAFDTLYRCLETLSKLVAPFVPFTAEGMHQNLVVGPFGASAPESVHLASFPAADASTIDERLSERMRAVRELVSLGLQVRTQEKMKVRQPLRTAHVVLAHGAAREELEAATGMMKEELNVLGIHFVAHDEAGAYVEVALKPNFRTLGQRGLGKEAQKLKAAMGKWPAAKASEVYAALQESGSVEVEGIALGLADADVAFSTRPGFAAAGGRIGVVVLETTLDDELRELGFLRELQSKVQAMRKDLGLDFADRIALGLSGGERLAGMLAKYKEDLAREVLASSVGAAGEGAREVEVEGEPVRVSVRKA